MQALTPENTSFLKRNPPPFSWSAALKSGLIAGVILLLVPQGIPWAALSSFTPVVMGRPAVELGAVGTVAVHLGLSITYAVLIGAIVRHIRTWRGILVGAAIGLPLYLLNRLVVAMAMPYAIGSETRVVVAHIVFCLFAAAAYKGMTRRAREQTQST